MTAAHDRRWKVGELAEATRLTVRALHHYDEVGLLVPSERTSAGHRLYDEQDVRRLYRVLALRELGLGLDEIASLLDDDEVSLVETVRRHLEQVERELEQETLRQRLRQILNALERSVEPPVEEFIDAMEEMTVIETMVEDVVMHIPADGAGDPPPPLVREGYRVVLLKERGGERVLPIWTGAQEGDLLAAKLGEWSQGRPMGPDLTAELLKAGGVRVERVVIESARENTFYASVTVAAGGESHEVDARPRDALTWRSGWVRRCSWQPTCSTRPESGTGRSPLHRATGRPMRPEPRRRAAGGRCHRSSCVRCSLARPGSAGSA